MKIHLLGPSGSGTTTLGKVISSALSIPHFDSDYFFWLPTTPPFTTIRPTNGRIELLRSTLENHESWVLSGSMLKWGDFLKPNLDLVIYKYLTQDIRIPRLLSREKERYGNRLDLGNDMYQQHLEFINWAKSYETGDLNMRSRASEEVWISKLNCKILRIENELTVQEELHLVLSQIKSI
jgi:adenylate kinase family enzyme